MVVDENDDIDLLEGVALDVIEQVRYFDENDDIEVGMVMIEDGVEKIELMQIDLIEDNDELVDMGN